MDQIIESVTGKDIIIWIICAYIVIQAVYKMYPEVNKWFKSKFTREATDQSQNDRLTGIESELKEVKARQSRDYLRMNNLTEQLNSSAKDIEESKAERQLMLSGLLAALKGLQELGTNGPTKQAQSEIEQYLNKQAHK